jgi:hypothetical protein
MAEHLCHADGCKTPVPRRMFMCRPHWFMVPIDMRGRLLGAYQPGQEKLDGTAWPSDEYLEIAQACIEVVARKEAVQR